MTATARREPIPAEWRTRSVDFDVCTAGDAGGDRGTNPGACAAQSIPKAHGARAIYTFELMPGPAFMGGNATLVIIEKDGEYLKIVDTSHDDWAQDDFGAWCEEYISRALKLRVIGQAKIRVNAPMRLKDE